MEVDEATKTRYSLDMFPIATGQRCAILAVNNDGGRSMVEIDGEDADRFDERQLASIEIEKVNNVGHNEGGLIVAGFVAVVEVLEVEDARRLEVDVKFG